MRPAVGQPIDLLDVFDEAMPQVYRYLLKAVGGVRALAEDLTQETFLAAVQATKAGRGDQVTTPWLIRVARNKMVDHFRRQEREQRKLQLLSGELDGDIESPDWGSLDRATAQQLLGDLPPAQRAALALRYLDDLPVAAVADHLDRSAEATESLLARARRNVRRLAQEKRDG